MDDQIYSSFRETFKDLDVKRLKEEDLKSDEAKQVSLVLLQRNVPEDSSVLSPFLGHIEDILLEEKK